MGPGRGCRAPQGSLFHQARPSCTFGELQTTGDGALRWTEEPEERPEVGGIARKPTSKSIVANYQAHVHAQVHVPAVRYRFGRGVMPGCLIHVCFPSF